MVLPWLACGLWQPWPGEAMAGRSYSKAECAERPGLGTHFALACVVRARADRIPTKWSEQVEYKGASESY